MYLRCQNEVIESGWSFFKESVNLSIIKVYAFSDWNIKDKFLKITKLDEAFMRQRIEDCYIWGARENNESASRRAFTGIDR